MFLAPYIGDKKRDSTVHSTILSRFCHALPVTFCSSLLWESVGEFDEVDDLCLEFVDVPLLVYSFRLGEGF